MTYHVVRLLPEQGVRFIAATTGDAERYINTQAQSGWLLHSLQWDSAGGVTVVMQREGAAEGA